MRGVLLALAVAVGCAGLGGCGRSSSNRPNDPAPPPQDSGADKGTTAPKPSPPPKK